jgi:PAS domain S-box-containing protein
MLTAGFLVPLVPRALALPSPAQLRAINNELQNEIAQRRRAEESLQLAHHQLELRVIQRTAELAKANEELVAEIARRREIEETLRKQASLLELAHDAIIVRDMNDRITFWNSGAVEMYGFERAEAVGAIGQELLKPANPEAIESLKAEVVRTGRADGELIHTCRNGKQIVVASRWALQRDSDDRPLAFLQINTDITAQKRAAEELRNSEERWRAVFENSAAGIVLADLSGRIQLVNSAFEKMLDFSREELRAMSIMEITHEDDRQSNRVLLSELLGGERDYFKIEKRYRRRGGAPIWVHNHVSLVPGTEGIPQFMMAIVEDVTERRRSAQALQEAQGQLAHMARVTTMGQLAASIAHEVNQPLAAVVTNANASLRWLGGSNPNLDEASAAMKRIVREGVRASEIIQGIRSLVKKAPTQTAPLNLNDLIREVLALTQHEMERNDVSVETELGADLPDVMGDRVQLQQVILNLVMNAIEATTGVTEGMKALMVASLREGSDQVVVAIRDTGPGIDPQSLGQLFEPFFTTKPTGMGMGLSISRSLIEAHGGQLWARAEESRGATFRFSLPVGTEVRV